MATLYTRYYTYKGKSNTKVSSGYTNVAIGSFTISGDTDHSIEQIVSIKYEHWHSSTGSSPSWPLTGRLMLSNGTSIDSDTVTLKFSGNILKCTNTWATLPTAYQFSLLSSIRTIAGTCSSSSADLYWRANSDYPMRIIVEFYDEPPIVYGPSIDKFTAYRVNSSGVSSDEGEYMRMTLKLSMDLPSYYSSATLRLYYEQNTDPDEAYSSWIDIKSYYPSNYMGSEITFTLSNRTWSNGVTWHFKLIFACGSESYFSYLYLERTFATLHLSPCSTGGVAIGGFSSSEEGWPKFESYIPGYFYDGILQVGDDPYMPVLTAMGIQSGVTEQLSLAGSSYTELSVTFDIPFFSDPIVVVGFVSNSTAGNFGRASCSVTNVTTTDFIIKAFNGDSTKRTPRIAWIAVGQTSWTASS